MVTVEIYGKKICPYCTYAKTFFESKNIDFDYKSVDDDEEFNVLHKKTGIDTVPQIFINGKFMGGWLKVKQMAEEGTLDPLLQD